MGSPAPAPLVAASPTPQLSSRIAARPGHGTPIETLAREAVARRLGSLPPETPFCDRLLRAYLALFEGPLSDQAVQAIDELVLMIKKKKNLGITATGGSVGQPGLLAVA